jgi:SAM-dependent methyltransferase
MDAYLLQSGDAGAARLSVLASAHRDDTERLFERLEVGAAARCLDLGCGIGAVTQLLAARFARDGGSVLGIDIDTRYVEVARENGAELGERVAFAAAGAHELAFTAEFDLVYSRFLLSHLRDPHDALTRMIRATRPGGTVAIEDVDFGGAFCHPPSPDFDRYLGWYDAMTRGNGGNPNLGRELFRMASEAGLVNVEMAVAQPTFSAGPGKDLAPTTLEHIGETLRQRQIASAEDLKATLAGLRSYAADPTTVLSMPRIFQVWGRVR